MQYIEQRREVGETDSLAAHAAVDFEMNGNGAESEFVFLRCVGEPRELLRLPDGWDELRVNEGVGLTVHQAAHDENADLRAESAKGYAFFDGGDAEPFCAGLNQPGGAGRQAMSIGIRFHDGKQIGGAGKFRRAFCSVAGGEQRSQKFEIGDESRAGNFYSSNWGRMYRVRHRDCQIGSAPGCTLGERRRWGHCAALR